MFANYAGERRALTDGQGNISLLRAHGGWRRTWSLIIPGGMRRFLQYHDVEVKRNAMTVGYRAVMDCRMYNHHPNHSIRLHKNANEAVAMNKFVSSCFGGYGIMPQDVIS